MFDDIEIGDAMSEQPPNDGSRSAKIENIKLVIEVIIVILSLVALSQSRKTNVLASEANRKADESNQLVATANALSMTAIAESRSANEIAIDANGIARSSLAKAEEAIEVAREGNQDNRTATLKANVEALLFFADSLDLTAETDISQTINLGLTPRLIKTEFWKSQQAEEIGQARYLFVFIVNHGPGIVTSVDISIPESSWLPKEGRSRPEGWLSLIPPFPLGTLGGNSGKEFYALLVDVLKLENIPILQGTDLQLLRTASQDIKNWNFKAISLSIYYKDETSPDEYLPLQPINLNGETGESSIGELIFDGLSVPAPSP